MFKVHFVDKKIVYCAKSRGNGRFWTSIRLKNEGKKERMLV